MRVYPAIDLWEGEAAFLAPEPGGTPVRISPDPVGLAERWAALGVRRIHLVDLNAALGRGENQSLVRRILSHATVPVQVGGGIRSEARVAELFDWGAERVIVSTRALRDPAWLGTVARRWPGRMILGLDRKGGATLVAGRSEPVDPSSPERSAATAGLPLGGVLVTNVETEGRLNGVGAVDKLLPDPIGWEWIAAGGVSRIEDLARLEEAGYSSAVVGVAAYRDPTRFGGWWEAPR